MSNDRRDEFGGITPQQYHAGLDKLWEALGIEGVQDEDVFTLAARAIGSKKSPGRRKRRSLSSNVICYDSSHKSKCELKASVRNRCVAIFTRGGDGWAHVTPKQARRLSSFLSEAADEAEQRYDYRNDRDSSLTTEE